VSNSEGGGKRARLEVTNKEKKRNNKRKTYKKGRRNIMTQRKREIAKP
jgi:hypothetical protein